MASASGALLSAAAAVFTLLIGAAGQERFPGLSFHSPDAYRLNFPPFTERPRPFQQYQQFQQSFQPPHRQPFQSPLLPPFEPGPGQWEPKHQFARNVSYQPPNSQFLPTQSVEVTPGGPDDFPRLFQDPQFDQLFQQELRHQIQLEAQREEGQRQHQQQQQQQPQQQQVEVQIQQSQQLERPQLQELHELHHLLEQQLQQHEQRQRQQLQLQQNQVDQHENFMANKLKPYQQAEQQTTPSLQPQQQQAQQHELQSGQSKPQRPTKTSSGPLTSRPQQDPEIQVIDLNHYMPFLQADQKHPQHQQKEVKQQQQRQQEQRLRQQQRQQETLRQQEERRQQEQRHKERLRQQRQQLQQQQQRLRQQEQEQAAQRQQRQQPLNNNGITGPGGTVVSGNRTEKPIKSVRDLFITSSCIDPPLTCPHPRIHFYLYTRTTQQEPNLIDVTAPESLRNTPFDPRHPIKVLIHGFQGGRQFSPSTDLRKAYFIRGDYNIFVVDYNSLVRLPCLSQVQWSPSFLALCISQLVGYVGNAYERQVPPDRFHLIGYSIGAHVAGLVANYVRDGKLGRITGLDPTIIFYQGSNRSHDLDPSDAHFIDVIHTGAGILGQRGPNGHVDYYVNGGTTQPGCQSDSLIKTLSCDHTKVSPYYVESIVTPVGFWASPCPNLFMYLLGFCQPKDEEYILMGEDAPHTARGIYYLTTNANKPYAKGFPGKKFPTKFPKWRPH